MNVRMQHKFLSHKGRNILYIMKKLLALVVVVSVLAVSASSFAASKKSSSAAAASIPATDFVGVVDMTEVFNSHPRLSQIRQQLNNLARQKENEARAAADKETDTAKKAQAVQAKRMELAQEEQKLMGPIYQDCQQAVREVVVRKKLTLVLDKFVVLIGGIDITQDVIQQLAKKK